MVKGLGDRKLLAAVMSIGPAGASIAMPVMVAMTVSVLYLLGFDTEVPSFIAPFISAFLAAWLYGVSMDDDPRDVWVICGFVSAAVWILWIGFSLVLLGFFVQVRFLEIGINSLVYVPFETMLGAYLGGRASRTKHGLLNAVSVAAGTCVLAVVIFYLPASLARGSKWAYVLLAFGGVAVFLLLVGWLISDKINLTAGKSALVARGRAAGLLALFAVWYALYIGPATEARFWIVDVTGRVEPGCVVFSPVGANERQFVVYAGGGLENKKYVDSLDGTAVPSVFFKIYQFGTPTYGSRNFHLAFVGDLPTVTSVHGTRGFDGLYLESLPWMTRAEAERRLGKRIRSPLLDRYHAGYRSIDARGFTSAV